MFLFDELIASYLVLLLSVLAYDATPGDPKRPATLHKTVLLRAGHHSKLLRFSTTP